MHFLTNVEKTKAIFAKIKAAAAKAVIFPKINCASIPTIAIPPSIIIPLCLPFFFFRAEILT